MFPFAVLGLVLLIRLFIGRLNHARIRRYIEDNGGKTLDISWNPFGPGWYGEKDSIIYKIRYRDAEGRVHEANCKTGFFSGVYFTKDIVIHRAANPLGVGRGVNQAGATGVNPSIDAVSASRQSLLSENRRLREENRQAREELKRLRN